MRLPEDMYTGNVFQTDNYGEVEILEYQGCKSVSVRFINTGSISSFPAGDIRRGLVKDPSKKRVCKHNVPAGFEVGTDIFIEKYDDFAKIVDYKDSNNVTIEFRKSKFTYTLCRYDLERGKVKDPYQENTLGILDVPIRDSNIHSVWKSMLYRVLGSNVKPYYQDVTIHPDWIYFSNFQSWMERQDWKGKVLDKDLLSEKEKMYSEDTCVFVSEEINAVLTTFRKGNTRGYYFNKDKEKWQAQATIVGTGEAQYLGRYDTEEEARVAYIKNKRSCIKAWISKQEFHLQQPLQLWLDRQTKPVGEQVRKCNDQGEPLE